jgi:hypothetical protein
MGFNNYLKEILYCSVLVGEPQIIKSVDDHSMGMKNTDFKDNIKKIRYESSTIDIDGSVIYAVYKNRRAYPNYLIRF